MNTQPAYQTIGADSTSISQLRAVWDWSSSIPKVLTATGDSRTTGIVSASATTKRLRMSRSIAAATVGSDMSCDMPPWPWAAASWAGSRCCSSAAVCGSSYCMRSHLVPQVIGAICAAWASCPVDRPERSPSQRYPTRLTAAHTSSRPIAEPSVRTVSRLEGKSSMASRTPGSSLTASVTSSAQHTHCSSRTVSWRPTVSTVTTRVAMAIGTSYLPLPDAIVGT